MLRFTEVQQKNVIRRGRKGVAKQARCVVGRATTFPKINKYASLIVAAALATGAVVGAEPARTRIDGFQLRDAAGAAWSLSEQKTSRAVVIAFLGTECPVAKLYASKLDAMAKEYAAKNVAFVGIDSNAQDAIDDMKEFLKDQPLSFPLLHDPVSAVADKFGATRTPEVFVLDAERTIRYSGRIDDQYSPGASRTKPQREDLRIALDELLADKPIAVAKTDPAGCYIGRVRSAKGDSEITWSGSIAGILQRSCVECHREGEIAPFGLSDYAEAAAWAETIRESVEEQRMPPWHAAPSHGKIRNERLLSANDKEQIIAWAKAGAPLGDAAKKQPVAKFVSGWSLPREPDLVVKMRDKPFKVPAEGVVDYQFFAVDPKLTEDTWVVGAQMIPGNRQVVHHGIVFISPPTKEGRARLGSLTGYVPGQGATIFPDGYGRCIPAGSKLIFQMHYTPSGTAGEDITTLGLIFGDPAKIEKEVQSVVIAEPKFEIPPHASDYRITATRSKFPANAELFILSAHMHLRGKSFQFIAHHSDGNKEMLLDIPRYDFDWQTAYQLAKPMPLPAGTSLECIGTFDNSAANPNNPDPAAVVRWGEQTWEEMMVGFVDVAIPRGQKAAAPVADVAKENERKAEAQRRATEFFARFDANGDGKLTKEETPASFKTFAFSGVDRNKDGWITKNEAVEAALRWGWSTPTKPAVAAPVAPEKPTAATTTTNATERS